MPTPFDPHTANAKGVGGYDWKAILNAEGDQRYGYDMLNQYLTGSMDDGTGPFASFMEQLLAPLATSSINALTTIGGKTPVNIDDLFARIANPNGMGADGQTVYDYLGGLAQQAVGKKLGPGSDLTIPELTSFMKLMNPLTTTGMDRISASQYDRQQNNAIRNLTSASPWDMSGVNAKKDFGDFFANSPFFKQYYGNRQGGAGNTQSAVVQQALANNTGAGQSQLPKLAGGGGGSGLYTP